jgi:hypothetical protein
MAEIHLNGRDYQLVTVDQLTLDEAITLWDYTRMGLDEIADLEGFHPGVIAALIHVSVQRGEPQVPAREIRRTVGGIQVADLEAVFMDASEEVEQVPPTSAAGPSSPSDGSGGDSDQSSGPVPADSPPGSSGSPGSATGATSARRISAV